MSQPTPLPLSDPPPSPPCNTSLPDPVPVHFSEDSHPHIPPSPATPWSSGKRGSNAKNLGLTPRKGRSPMVAEPVFVPPILEENTYIDAEHCLYPSGVWNDFTSPAYPSPFHMPPETLELDHPPKLSRVHQAQVADVMACLTRTAGLH